MRTCHCALPSINPDACKGCSANTDQVDYKNFTAEPKDFSTYPIVSARIQNNIPSAYRLLFEKATGKYILQGLYNWTWGYESGYDWKDMETLER